MKNFALAAAALFVAIPQVSPAQTTYSNRATFSTASGALTTETFSGCGVSTRGFSGSLSSTSGTCSGILPGVTYSPQANGSLYIAGSGQSFNPTTALGVDFSNGDPITIVFSQAMSTFGADLFQNGGGGSQAGSGVLFSVTLFLGAANVGNFNYVVAPFTGSFFGVTGTSFDQVRIAQANGFAVIDNVSFGAGAIAAAVPEPATWAMMIIGFGLAGFALRRRPSKITTRVQFA